MESLQTWLNDRKNLPIVVGALVVVLLVAIVVWRLTAGGGGTEVSTGDLPPAADQTGMPEGMPPGTPGAPGAPAAPGTPGTPVATPGADQTGAAPAGAAPAGEKEPPIEEARVDPFMPYFGPKPRRTKLSFTSQLPKPEIRRVAPVQLDLTVEEEEERQPPRRMAGILKNGRVFAIIVEERGETPVTTIVKPGDVLGQDLTVERILTDKVIVRSERTGRTMEIPKSAGRVQPRQPAAPTTPRARPGGSPGPVPMPMPRGGVGPLEAPPPPRGP
jgi:hypothetical protein